MGGGDNGCVVRRFLYHCSGCGSLVGWIDGTMGIDKTDFFAFAFKDAFKEADNGTLI